MKATKKKKLLYTDAHAKRDSNTIIGGVPNKHLAEVVIAPNAGRGQSENDYKRATRPSNIYLRTIQTQTNESTIDIAILA